jgi:hypothetical protein
METDGTTAGITVTTGELFIMAVHPVVLLVALIV